jgi:Na+/proline symporter/signal transduction histidine kinase/ActR/RegA family two-component response regulator
VLDGMTVIVAAIAYIGALFLVATWGDRGGRRFIGHARPLIYSLSLAIYCTTWTYYGSVGIASARGLDFLPIYIGPILLIGFGGRLVARIAALARAQNITSVADFVAARYGKSQSVAAMVALVAIIGVAPYIALQLKAIAETIPMVIGSFEEGRLNPEPPSSLFFLAIAAVLAAFAMAFGTRRIDPTEHQEGLILAIAAESVVKLLAFLVVGGFVVWGMFDGLADLARIAQSTPGIAAVMETRPDPATWIVTTMLSAVAVLMLPRQFHVMIVENREPSDIRTASWLFPLYLVAINLFVAPLAIAGLATFPNGMIDRDLTVLALPLTSNAHAVALLTMIGGLSAATAMVIVASVALSITVSNDLAMPLLLRGRAARADAPAGDIGSLVLFVRRAAILGVLLLAYAYIRIASGAALASLGLLSFAAVAQIAPAFLGGLFWRRANARGALAGLLAGSLIWLYTMFAPSLELNAGFASFLAHGPLAIAWLRPAALLGFTANPLVAGVTLSLGANIAAFIAFSLSRQANPSERMQANVFVGGAPTVKAQAFRLWRASTTAGELEATIARYLGAERARSALKSFEAARGLPLEPEAEADAHLIRHAEHLLASAIGGSSSRLVISLLFRRRAMSGKSALKLIDDASAALQSNRDLLQHALDHARQGITVFDRNLGLLCWNREFSDLFETPPSLLRPGVGLDEIVRFNAERGVYGPGPVDDFVAERMESQLNAQQPRRLRLHPSGRVIEIRSARLPDGGIVTTYTDVTQSVEAEQTLAAANERLERRVRERTEQLERLNQELARAKTEAEAANVSKTRFLAAASHDILQPLNAARLYASALTEAAAGANAGEPANLARNVDASLEAVEEILAALLDISRLDAGATRPEISDAPLAEILRQLEIEFAPMARAKGLKLIFVPSSLNVRSDRRLLRRLLRNLVSNAIKYTLRGKVLVGCRRRGERLRVEVWDTGIGIPLSKQRVVFEEFQRLEQGARAARGLGLGLSIVERLGRVLGHDLELRSTSGAGTMVSVTAPRGAASARSGEAASPRSFEHADEPLNDLVVLAIDNEPRVAEGMRALLGKWGCLVATAAGVKDAPAAARAMGAPPDVIIADYHLDDGDGIEAIGALRAAFGADIPAILATADRSPAARDAAQRARIAVLNKPVKPAQLRALLMRCKTMRLAAE